MTEGPEAVEHVRKCYAGTLMMADAWLGKFLDVMDELGAWKDTTVILTVGKPLVIESDPTQQVKATLEKLVD